MKGSHLSSLIISLLVILIACKKEDIKKNEIQPCMFCPIDFRVTDYEPAWSPDGKYIAYKHSDPEASKNGIYLITSDGKENRLWHQGVGIEAPAWSPDSQWLAFSQGGQIWKKKVNGDSLIQITEEGSNLFPTWSPDGEWIAYDSNVNSPNGMYFIWKVSNKSLQKRRIAYDPSQGEIRFPSWTNDNKIIHIRYQVDVTSSEVFIMDDEGRDAKRLTYNNAADKYPKHSPNTNKIAYTSQDRTGNPNPQIWVMNEDGTSLKQLTNTQAYSCAWSPDGQQIVYTDARAVNGRLWLMNSDGSGKKQLTSEHHFN